MINKQTTSKKFQVIIDSEICKGCEICVDMCPYKVLEMTNIIGAYGVPIPQAVREEKCTGCDVCVIFCPDMAITVKKVEPNEV